ncbi:serine hydrolase domain-containing protein [Streptomyces sp. 147326]|uniref:serine hydrolase domain-containing protein n=1 Tax=Streptomyces sp. 147326 TaxID=3074379 RepID=UPI00385790FF
MKVVYVSRMAPLCTEWGAMMMVALSGFMNPPTYAAGDDREKRSAEVLQELVPSARGPGCAAAVGKRGVVVWEAGSGKADLATGRAITSKTVFDMASNSKQFTADSVLLLAGRHQLALNDPLSDFLDNPPAWTREVTLGDLMRHTSGIPDYQDLLEANPGEFVRWADNYRTGRIGGTELLTGVTEGAVSVGDVLRRRGIEEGRYGAGILLLPDKSLVHRGDWEQFHSTFKVSPDRNTAVTVVCNTDSPDNFRAANQLLDIWTT